MAIIANNRVEWPIAECASLRLGAAFVPLPASVPLPSSGKVSEHTPVTDARDGLGRVVSHGYVLAGVPMASSFTYDASGDLLSKIDPEGNRASYGYDGRGRRVFVSDPDAGRQTCSPCDLKCFKVVDNLLADGGVNGVGGGETLIGELDAPGFEVRHRQHIVEHL